MFKPRLQKRTVGTLGRRKICREDDEDNDIEDLANPGKVKREANKVLKNLTNLELEVELSTIESNLKALETLVGQILAEFESKTRNLYTLTLNHA